MNYLPTLGEQWPHSRGNVGNIPYMDPMGMFLLNLKSQNVAFVKCHLFSAGNSSLKSLVPSPVKLDHCRGEFEGTMY